MKSFPNFWWLVNECCDIVILVTGSFRKILEIIQITQFEYRRLSTRIYQNILWLQITMALP